MGSGTAACSAVLLLLPGRGATPLLALLCLCPYLGGERHRCLLCCASAPTWTTARGGDGGGLVAAVLQLLLQRSYYCFKYRCCSPTLAHSPTCPLRPCPWWKPSVRASCGVSSTGIGMHARAGVSTCWAKPWLDRCSRPAPCRLAMAAFGGNEILFCGGCGGAEHQKRGRGGGAGGRLVLHGMCKGAGEEESESGR